MGSTERRRKLTLDEVNAYWHNLREGAARPELHKLCNAIRTIDMALAETSPALCRKLSIEGWSRIRNDCFDYLISSFPGHFIVYDASTFTPLEAGNEWPKFGTLEFYPESVNRREDSYQAALENIHSEIIVRYRWCFAEGRANVTPDDFTSYTEKINRLRESAEAAEVRHFLNELHAACAEEASKLKKIAHRQWWQLHYQADACHDSRHKNELKQQMTDLELLWGKSAAQ
ncbi:MAG TPA: hypothetical protein V6C76_18020 [Drouetiella sp.]